MKLDDCFDLLVHCKSYNQCLSDQKYILRYIRIANFFIILSLGIGDMRYVFHNIVSLIYAERIEKINKIKMIFSLCVEA